MMWSEDDLLRLKMKEIPKILRSPDKWPSLQLYIDVRGIWPLLIEGVAAKELRGAYRTITVEEALAWVPPPIVPLD